MSTQQLPKTMKGVIIEKTGGTEVMQWKTDLPVPEPKENEVLVKNEFLGLNYIDTYFRTGLYKPPSLPYILGKEAAGRIVAVGPGSVHGFQPGDRVVWMASYAYAEYTAVPALHTAKIPDGVSSETAAAALLQGLTALTFIRESYAVQKGDYILVHAAAGGVGLWLCQLLKAIGAHVIGTASTPEKRQRAKDNGAEFTLDSASDVAAQVASITSNAGVAAAFDGVGKATFDISLASLARKGTLVSFGNASGTPDPLVIARLTPKNAKVLRPTVFNYIVTREEFVGYVEELFGFVERDGINVHVSKTYKLEDVARAHEDLEGRKTQGKILLTF